MIKKLYESYAQPFARVVRGVPTSWDPNTAAISFPFPVNSAVWSPCNKFIAIGANDSMRVDILDSATLKRLQHLEPSQETTAVPMVLTFSPDTRMLTCLGRRHAGHPGNLLRRPVALIISWDLQTGGVVSAITLRRVGSSRAMIAYSMNGKTFGVLQEFETKTILSIYDVVSGEYVGDIYKGKSPLHDFWTHGESLRFATADPTTITISEVEFAPHKPRVEVETLSIPENVHRGTGHGPRGLGRVLQTQFLLASHRFALVYAEPTRGVLVWNVRDSKCLLRHMNIDFDPLMTFSSDGHFFACSARGMEIYLWRESPTGYVLHGKFPAITQYSRPLLSPNGKSVIAIGNSAVQLWHTEKIMPTPSDIPTRAPHDTKDFLLDFLPDRPLVVVTRQADNVVTVLDLKSGLPLLVIESSMEVYGLKAVGDAIVAIGDGKVVTWKLLEGNLFPDSRASVEDSVLTVNFNDGASTVGCMIAASISLDLRYIATLRTFLPPPDLYLYDASTGKRLAVNRIVEGGWPLWFAPGRPNICCTRPGKGAEVVAITEDGFLDNRIEVPVKIEDGSWGCPWMTSDGYQVTTDGWILGAAGKRLLMLPPPWHSYMENRVWNGQFLALVHGTLPEPVILELE